MNYNYDQGEKQLVILLLRNNANINLEQAVSIANGESENSNVIAFSSANFTFRVPTTTMRPTTTAATTMPFNNEISLTRNNEDEKVKYFHSASNPFTFNLAINIDPKLTVNSWRNIKMFVALLNNT